MFCDDLDDVVDDLRFDSEYESDEYEEDPEDEDDFEDEDDLEDEDDFDSGWESIF